MSHRLGIALLAIFALTACVSPAPSFPVESPPAAAGKSIFVTRHMQKAEGEDPPLNAEGAVAAERLADMLLDEGVSAIFATATRRAMETATPLSIRIGVPIETYDPKNPQSLATSIGAVEGSVLVVGHSNTVPDLIANFGGYPPPLMTEQDYGTVFRVDEHGRVHAITLN